VTLQSNVTWSPKMCISNASAHYNVAGSGGIGTSGFGLNMFAKPEAAWNNIRQPILGHDNSMTAGRLMESEFVRRRRF
jgi:hypothetical protein